MSVVLRSGPRKILVVGQTPPPHGGQAIMIGRLLETSISGISMFHVRMAFSKDMSDLKRLRLGKISHLFRVIFEIMALCRRHGIDTLYYPPSGPEFIPVLRDIMILCSTRWMFEKTIFHFHAAGLSEIYPRLIPCLRPFFRWAFMRPDLAIQLSEYNPPDGAFLQARQVKVVPNGVEDEATDVARREPSDRSTVQLLFVGLVSESKGIFVLLEAMMLLKKMGLCPKLSVVGRFASDEVESRARAYLADNDLEPLITFCGPLVGSEKLQKYADADIFCLPTYFESESFSLVTVEAMSFSLPVVASRWRGLQSVVSDGKTGILVPPHDAKAVASSVRKLISSPSLRSRMGRQGRERFIGKFSMSSFRVNIAEALSEVGPA